MSDSCMKQQNALALGPVWKRLFPFSLGRPRRANLIN
jgi:hypothetical protein